MAFLSGQRMFILFIDSFEIIELQTFHIVFVFDNGKNLIFLNDFVQSKLRCVVIAV